LVSLFAVTCILVSPSDTNAGVISFFNSLISSPQVNASQEIGSERANNSQTITLLEPAININPAGLSHDLAVLDDSVLETPTGPSGTAREVEEKLLSTDKVSIYIVRESDSLSSIAQMFNVTPNTIMWANDMKSAKDLKKGQELIILPISGIKYTVKKGDTLKGIALKYQGDVDEIMSFNNMPENVSLVAGDEIIIPNGENISTGTNNQASNSKKPVLSTSVSKSDFIRPAKGIKTQGLHGKYKTAVDIAAPVGTSIYASSGGKVIVAKTGGYNGGYGNYIVIEHANGMQTVYAHLSSVDISSGDKVSQGALIGKMGSTGRSTGSHLHFEILGAKNWNPFN
jgi:murein DD-endopeptidase MepM/ murein hydrolase activator NlpD